MVNISATIRPTKVFSGRTDGGGIRDQGVMHRLLGTLIRFAQVSCVDDGLGGARLLYFNH